MSTRTFNPYPLIGTQLADGMDAIAADLTTESTIDDFVDSIYDCIQPIYYPNTGGEAIPKQIEIEVKSVVYNMVNAYNNKVIQYTLPYDEQQMKFIRMMLGKTTTNTTPINAIDIWLSDIEDNISKSALTIEQQTPLLLAIESGKAIYDYWITKVSTPGEWSKFFQEPAAANFINIPYWLAACVNGALIGANASQKGLIAPTTDIVSVNIVSALIGALSIGAGKVIFKWVPEIQPVELTLDNNGMLSGGFSEAIDINDVGSGANQLKKDNKCRTNSKACNNVQCVNNCINTGTCTGVA